MAKKFIFIITFLTTFLLFSCSRRSHPAKTNPEVETRRTNPINPETKTTEAKDNEIKNTDSAAVVAKKTIVKRKEKAPIPKVIVVNDNAAHKSVDGRLYYDMMGHRYWRNYKDGKYYLFNKDMYNDDAFKPTK